MSEDKINLIAVHQIVLGKKKTVQPGKSFTLKSSDKELAATLVAKGAARSEVDAEPSIAERFLALTKTELPVSMELMDEYLTGIDPEKESDLLHELEKLAPELEIHYDDLKKANS